MLQRLDDRLLHFLSTPFGFNLYASIMYTDPALLAMTVVGVERTAKLLFG